MSEVDQIQKILDDAPTSKANVNKTTTDKIRSFCFSRVGLSLISFVLFIVIFLIAQPRFIFKKTAQGLEKGDINYTLVFILSVIGSLLVYFIPILINKNKCAN
jgi:hypothetical protein